MYSPTPMVENLQRTSIAEETIHFWQPRYCREAFIDQLSYKAHLEVRTTYLWSRKEMNYIYQVPPEEKVLVTGRSSFGLNPSLQQEEMRVVRKDEVLRKFTKVRLLQPYPFACLTYKLRNLWKT